MNETDLNLDAILNEDWNETPQPNEPDAAPRPRRKSTAEGDARPHPEKKRPAQGEAAQTARPRKKRTDRRHPLLGALLTALFVCCLVFSALNLHPGFLTSASKASQAAAAPVVTPEPVVPATPEPTPEQAVIPVEPTPSPEPTPEPTPEPVHYSIPENALVAPAPQESGYGEVSNDDAYAVLDVIQRARDYGLLGPDERTVFDPNANFYRGGDAKSIRYYLDETILVLLWKEDIDGNCVSLCEVKVADGSQLRRKFAGDSFGSASQFYATELARSTNAVVAMNADYYLFRDFGIVAYNRELFRFNTDYAYGYSKYNCVDTLFVTSGGDFLYKHVGETSDWNAMQQYIRDNDILFSISFGPVLVNDGIPLACDSYAVGEVNSGYSRAGIGQVDKLHYLYMVLSHSPEKEARWTVTTFAQHFAEKGVITAFCLDGGQTGEVVFRGEPYNHIDFSAERLVSDIIYFASALPEGGAQG